MDCIFHEMYIVNTIGSFQRGPCFIFPYFPIIKYIIVAKVSSNNQITIPKQIS